MQEGRVLSTVGTCRWCKRDFCQSHRLLEVHNCLHVQVYRQHYKDVSTSALNAGNVRRLKFSDTKRKEKNVLKLFSRSVCALTIRFLALCDVML